jgi:hypothetical protein
VAKVIDNVELVVALNANEVEGLSNLLSELENLRTIQNIRTAQDREIRTRITPDSFDALFAIRKAVYGY